MPSIQDRTEPSLARLVQQEVKAQMKRYAMSRKRDDFINRVVEVLIPALKHHYRAVLGQVNHRTDQIEKWREHEEGFLDQFAERLLEPTKAKGLDRGKAVEQALKELMENDGGARRHESQMFQKSHKFKTLVPLPRDAHEDFLARVREIADTILES